MSTALCDAFYHGVQSSKVICPKFCCGNQTFRFCCSDCNLHFPFNPVDCQTLSDSSHMQLNGRYNGRACRCGSNSLYCRQSAIH
ncbi:hypothetical protein SprV_0401414600 [Sparganum proliferum]